MSSASDSLSTYYSNLEKKIRIIFSRKQKQKITFDILDINISKQNKLIVLKEKQKQMKIGEIWQEVLGSYEGFVNLRVGHETGLDIISHSRKMAIELKNRTNTDNSSSRKSNFDKLARFKQLHPKYTCIYANINTDNEKDIEGKRVIINHNGVYIEHQIGMVFLRNILGEHTEEIIEFLKETITKYDL